METNRRGGRSGRFYMGAIGAGCLYALCMTLFGVAATLRSGDYGLAAGFGLLALISMALLWYLLRWFRRR